MAHQTIINIKPRKETEDEKERDGAGGGEEGVKHMGNKQQNDRYKSNHVNNDIKHSWIKNSNQKAKMSELIKNLNKKLLYSNVYLL